MNKKIIGIIGFVLGGAAGLLAGHFYLSEKYRKVTENEIAQVKQFYKWRDENKKSKPEADIPATPAPQTSSVPQASLTGWSARNAYTTLTNSYGAEVKTDRPYVIPYDSIGDNGNDVITVTYYSDGVLADETDAEFSRSEIEDRIGVDILSNFDFEDDESLGVRNNLRKTDYEIVRDLRTYSDVVGEKPYLRGD